MSGRKLGRFFALHIVWILFLACVPVKGADFTDLVIPEYRVENVPMKEALMKLRAYGIPICLETVRHAAFLPEDGTISMEEGNRTVREILNELVSKDPRYRWNVSASIIHDYSMMKIINVLPVRAEQDPGDLMNTRVQTFEIADGKAVDVMQRIEKYVPELSKRMQDIISLHGGGVAGSEAGAVFGNPEIKTRMYTFSMTLEDVTVRQILNEIALRSSGLCWIYETTIDSRVLPQWNIF